MDFLSNINLKKNLLTKNELKACELICKDLTKVQQLSLTEMSAEIKVTKTTILRFCQKMGYSGYTEFRYDCVKYVNSLNNAEDTVNRENDKIINVEKIYIDTIKLMHYTLNDEIIKRLVTLIKDARRVRCVGEINSAVTCLQLKYALAMYGIDAEVLSSPAEVKAIDLAATKDDLILMISVTGKSETIKEALALQENNCCKIALVTMNAQSHLENEVDAFILLPSVATLKNKSLLDSVPIFSVFVEILLHYIND